MADSALASQERAIHAIKLALGSLQTTGQKDSAIFSNLLRDHVSPLFEKFEDTELKKMPLEFAFRSVLSDILHDGDALTDVHTKLYDYLDLLLTSTELGLLDDGLPILLIEEILDCQTIEKCEQIFGYMESRIDRLTVKMVPTRGKGLTLLRLCNELLKRLSKTKNTVFCGRILMFLASVFPLGERSGVNLRGEFNIENVTHYEGEEETERMEVDSKANEPVEDEETKFYKKFWSLQKFLSNPPLVFQSGRFDIMKEGIEETLSQFAKVTSHENALSGVKTDGSDSASASMRKRKHRSDGISGSSSIMPIDGSDIKRDFFFPKFLTSRNLLALEMADPYFRRHILVQFLILFQYLRGYTQKEKETIAAIKPTSAKGGQQTFQIDDAQETWITQTRERIIAELRGTPPNGKKFTETIEHVLAHEENWIKWKANNCQTFEREPLTQQFVEESRVKLQKLEQEEPIRIRFSMGTNNLTQLWTLASADIETVLRRRSTPSFSEYLNHIKEEVRDDERKSKDSIPKNDIDETRQVKVWRALRLASKHNIHIFPKLSADIDLGLLIKAVEEDKKKPEGSAKDTSATVNSNGDSTATSEQVPQSPEGRTLAIEENTMDVDSTTASLERTDTADTIKTSLSETSIIIVNSSPAPTPTPTPMEPYSPEGNPAQESVGH